MTNVSTLCLMSSPSFSGSALPCGFVFTLFTETKKHSSIRCFSFFAFFPYQWCSKFMCLHHSRQKYQSYKKSELMHIVKVKDSLRK